MTKYWVLAHLLLVAGTLSFAPTVSAWFGLWAAGSLLLFTRFLPPVLKGESFWSARARVSHALGRDVVLWALLLAALYVGVGLFNGPRALVLDLSSVDLMDLSAKPQWIYTAPKMPFAPSSVNPAEGVPFFVGLLGGLACAVAVRTALPRGQRLLALVGLGLLAGVAALGAIVVGKVTGAAPTLALLGGVGGASALWLMLFCVCLGVVAEAFLEGRPVLCAAALLAACLDALGVFAFGGALMVTVAGVLAVVWVLFAGFTVHASGRGPALLWHVVLMAPVAVAVFAGLALMPAGHSLTTLFGHEPLNAAWEAFSSQWPFRQGLAASVLDLNPMLGLGPNGFAHFAELVIPESDAAAWGLWEAGGTALPNDFMRLLVERGLIGAILLLLPGCAMLGRCVVRGVAIAQNRTHTLRYRYVFVFAGSLVGVVSMLAMSLIGAPLHAPAPLCAFLIVCACMAGWMPRPR